MTAKLIDKSVESLLREFENGADELVDLLAEIPMATKDDKRELLVEIMTILAGLLKYAKSWSEATLQHAYNWTQEQALNRLTEIGDYEDVLGIDLSPNLNELQVLFEEEIRAALSSIESVASALSSNRGISKFVDPKISLALLAGTATAVTLATMRRQLRKNVSSHLVTIIGQDGRAYTYSLQYYVKLVATNKVTKAMTQATMDQAMQVGWDLLRVSSQPSTIGDYCDEYRAKVVSISGSHPTYPSMSLLPGGGAPFHPNCHHYMELFTDGMEQSGAISEEFMKIAATGNPSPNDLQRLWKQSHK